jgi:alkylhydroperoxidase/carboxymuconolactone decarboxylase family protein YurZ
MSDDLLPPIVEKLSRELPSVWTAYQSLGQATSEAGPLDERTIHLVRLALAAGNKSEGAVHSHVRRGLACGLTAEEVRHVALLAITTLGWPSAIATLSWIEDELSNAASSI